MQLRSGTFHPPHKAVKNLLKSNWGIMQQPIVASHRRPRTRAAVLDSLEKRALLSGSVTLVKDINLAPDTTFRPENMTTVGSFAYFTQLDINYGYELWRTDGTTAGTVMIKDINPGKAWSSPSEFTAVGSLVYFAATSANAGRELWVTDGTAAGTSMVKDINPGTDASFPGGLRAVGSSLIFLAKTPAAGYELWKSDGTAAGTNMIVDLRPGTAGTVTSVPNEQRIGVANGAYLFSSATNGTTSGLYRTDGTAAGTYLLKSTSSFVLGSIISAGTRAVLVPGTTSTDFQITDGTVAGTVGGGSTGSNVMVGVAGTNVFFTGYDYISDRYTVLRKPLAGGSTATITLPSGTGRAIKFLPFGTSMLFTADSPTGQNLFRITSTGLSATLLKDFVNYNNDLTYPVTAGSNLFFANESTQELWKSDGTTAGTLAVAALTDFYTDQYFPKVSMVAAGNYAVLVNNHPTSGLELWSSNGTAFALLKDIQTGTGQYGAYGKEMLGKIGSYYYYRINDGVNGEELWRTDGTAAGTQLVKDILAGSASAYPRNGVSTGSRLFFSATSPATGYELWISDGTAAGTTQVLDIYPGSASSYPERGVVLNGIYYFPATTVAGTELWRSDGTAAGTRIVRDITTGASSTDISALTVFNGRVYFSAGQAGDNYELWSSDGTEAGTVRVKDIAPGTASSYPANFYVAGGALFFAASDGTSGTELWMTDGSEAGTVRVADISTGAGSSSPGHFLEVGSTLYFAATTSATGRELFQLNRKTMQVTLVSDIIPGSTGSSPQWPLTFAGAVYFVGSSPGYELMRLEGGAVTKVTNFTATGAFGIGGLTLRSANGALFFVADDGTHGSELYRYDAVSAPELFELNWGLYGAAVDPVLPLPDGVFFHASTFEYGNEPMRLNDTTAPRAWQTRFDFELGQAVRSEFTEPVSFSGASSATLIDLATGAPVPGIVVGRQLSVDGTRVDFGFSTPLPDGNYRLQFNGTDYRDGAGNVIAGTQSVEIHVLRGDINRDRTVNFDDLLVLAQNYGQTGRTFSQGNIDYSPDGLVSFDDLLLIAQRYGTTLLSQATHAKRTPAKQRAADVLT